jgi:hypothetical protein
VTPMSLHMCCRSPRRAGGRLLCSARIGRGGARTGSSGPVMTMRFGSCHDDAVSERSHRLRSAGGH